MVRVLLLCTGNVCRSPMAEGILRHLVRREGHSGEFVVESAGTHAAPGAPVSASSVEVSGEHGIDIRGHVARPLGRRMVDRTDLILAMEPEHAEFLRMAYPEAGGKCFVLTSYCQPEGDPLGVPDPIGLGIEAYRETYDRIDGALRAALPRILALAGLRNDRPDESRGRATGTVPSKGGDEDE